ncbi:hypothetical protein CDAR_619471 [Caerostris darwini]|uniref:Uncharacterized protein n=1 Tax=Caerostris darwini TaxID=1538125 RepID=A0AAV4TR82_9ARAC|nr:hypothetical protein CDAR_619471 [Caerostris darwini]
MVPFLASHNEIYLASNERRRPEVFVYLRHPLQTGGFAPSSLRVVLCYGLCLPRLHISNELTMNAETILKPKDKTYKYVLIFMNEIAICQLELF